MGFGDDLIATGLAKGMHASGKLAAFGDGKKIIWGPWSDEIFRHNPNVARPGDEWRKNLYWVDYYKGHRNYNKLDAKRSRWVWNYKFQAVPGELFFSKAEVELSRFAGEEFVFIEPNVPWHKSVAANKDWGLKNYQAVADRLLENGYDVVQTKHGRDKLQGVRFISTPTFRDALALMSRARVVLVPEGGLHHGAAAVGVPAVVLFGGFIPPAVTGYKNHINFVGGVVEACGSLMRCEHCRAAMDSISVDQVYESVKSMIRG